MEMFQIGMDVIIAKMVDRLNNPIKGVITEVCMNTHDQLLNKYEVRYTDARGVSKVRYFTFNELRLVDDIPVGPVKRFGLVIQRAVRPRGDIPVDQSPPAPTGDVSVDQPQQSRTAPPPPPNETTTKGQPPPMFKDDE